jgi:hypothetical protein
MGNTKDGNAGRKPEVSDTEIDRYITTKRMVEEHNLYVGRYLQKPKAFQAEMAHHPTKELIKSVGWRFIYGAEEAKIVLTACKEAV